MQFSDLKITTYQIPDTTGVMPKVEIAYRGDTGWAVVDGSFVMNKEFEWEYEPLSSSRDDEFIARTRYESAEKAFEHYEARRSRLR